MASLPLARDCRTRIGGNSDSQMQGFLSYFLDEQVQSAKEIADMAAQVKLVGPSLGLWTIDQKLLAE